jgi:hypothetical protein
MDKRQPKSLKEIDAARAKNKVTALREKLSKAAENPDVQAAMVRYIQVLLREDEKR